MENVIFKTDLLRGAKGEKGDTGSTESVPTDGVLAYVGETTPQGYEEIEISDVFTDIYAEIDAVKDIVSDAYDVTATYAVGDYCIYNNVLYKCNTAIATPEAFTPAKWDATNVAEELGELTERVTPPASTITTGAIISQIYTSSNWKWSLFVPLPLYILDKYTISVVEAQIVLTMFLTIEEIVGEYNGIYVIVSEDLTSLAQSNRRSQVKLTLTPKS